MCVRGCVDVCVWLSGCVYLCMGVGVRVRVSCVFAFVCFVCVVCVVCVGGVCVCGVCVSVCLDGVCVSVVGVCAV